MPDFLSMGAADLTPMCKYRRETLEGVAWGVTGGVGRLSKIGADPQLLSGRFLRFIILILKKSKKSVLIYTVIVLNFWEKKSNNCCL